MDINNEQKGNHVIKHQNRKLNEVSMKPVIVLAKTDFLVDELIPIVLKGLPRNHEISVLMTLVENKKKFAACGHYTTDQQGCVDTFRHASLGGSFQGVKRMGLFTYTKEISGSSRLIKVDVTTPYDVTLSVHDGHRDVEALDKEFVVSRARALAVTSLRRWYKAPGVRRIPVRDGRLRGSVFIPPGEGPFPGVVDVFGMAGGLLDFRAALLASHGFLTYALAYFAYEDLSYDPQDINSEYFLEAVDWFSRHPMVQPGGVGMIGHSLGGSLCLSMSTISPHVKCVVNINGNPSLLIPRQYDFGEGIVQGLEELTRKFYQTPGLVSLKTYQPPSKAASPMIVSNLRLDVSKGTFNEEGFIQKDAFNEYTMKDHLIPMWRGSLKGLIIVGEDDLCTDPQWYRDHQNAVPVEKRDNFRFIFYPGAGHLIEPPYSPHCRRSYSKHLKVDHLWGGRPEEHAVAQIEAWREILTFLHSQLSNRSRL